MKERTLSHSLFIDHHLFNLMFEDLPGVVVAQASAHTHARHPLRLQKYLSKVCDCDLECLVAGNLCLAFQEALKMQ